MLVKLQQLQYTAPLFFSEELLLDATVFKEGLILFSILKNINVGGFLLSKFFCKKIIKALITTVYVS